MKRVAIQGYPGSFHQIVAHSYLGTNIDIHPCATFREVTRQVAEGEVDYGVMAVENSIAGTILPNLGLLHRDQVQVVGEFYLHIRQNLMVLPGVAMDQIEEVHSHPMALLQCVDYLDAKPWKLVEAEDTALSAQKIAEGGIRNAAAIASDLAAEMFGLEIIAPDIHTIKNNYTRFLILRPVGDPLPQGANKASLCFQTDHKKGSLLAVLRQMEQSTINMTKLQSSPVPSEPWHYMFHIDMEFDNIEEYNQVIENMRQASEQLHVYGVYPRG